MGKKRDFFNNFIYVLRDTLYTFDISISFRGGLRSQNRRLRKYNVCVYKLPGYLKRDYVKYYKSFGFKHVRTDWIEYIYGITGLYDRRYIPDDIFNLYIDYPYDVDREFWQNKAFQPKIFPEAKYPEAIVKRLHGCYYNDKDERISPDCAINIIRQFDEVVIKHVIGGAGTGIEFVRTKDIDEGKLKNINYDFIIQKIIKQSPLMAQFNESSVNIIKITSYMFNGIVHILCSRVWAGAEGQRLSNTFGQNGFQVVIDADGNLDSESSNLVCRSVSTTPSGIPFESIRLDYYKECIELVKKGHERLFYFPFISWDFTQDSDGNTILIEYNLKWHVLLDIQLLSGPAFGNITDEVLREAAKNVSKNKSLILK